MLKKAKSSKLVQIDFCSEPHLNMTDEILRNDKEIVIQFFRKLNTGTVNCISVPSVQPTPSISNQRSATISSVDSVPIRDTPLPKQLMPRPDFIVSKDIDFGTVEPKSQTLKKIQIINSSDFAQAWILQTKPNVDSSANFNSFLVSRREGSLEP